MEATAPNPVRLYTPQQIAAASFLGSPLAACFFFARNYRRLGDPGRATNCLVWGVVGTIVLFAITYFLPDKFPNMVIPIAYTVGILQMAKQIHGNAVAQHLAAGGRKGSTWEVVGISLLFLILILAVIFGIVMLLPEEPEPLP